MPAAETPEQAKLRLRLLHKFNVARHDLLVTTRPPDLSVARRPHSFISLRRFAHVWWHGYLTSRQYVLLAGTKVLAAH